MILFERSVIIAAPSAVVRAQFGDVGHHQRSSVHAGVSFEVLDDDVDCCRYRQRTKIGPLASTQELALERRGDGLLINTITNGPFRGAAIVFEVADVDERCARVRARFESQRWSHRILRPLIDRVAGASLAAALEEDRIDLESGRYPSSDVTAP